MLEKDMFVRLRGGEIAQVMSADEEGIVLNINVGIFGGYIDAKAVKEKVTKYSKSIVGVLQDKDYVLFENGYVLRVNKIEANKIYFDKLHRESKELYLDLKNGWFESGKWKDVKVQDMPQIVNVVTTSFSSY